MNRDFVEMLSEFSATGVEYLLVGAHAFAVHARPRATGDLDLWVRPTAENEARILEALRRFGAPMFALEAGAFQRPGEVVQLGVPPHRIDLLTSISGVEFEEAWTRRIEVEVEGVLVPILGREDLIRNKRAADRPQDRADVSVLEGGESST